jgi:ribonuclease HII
VIVGLAADRLNRHPHGWYTGMLLIATDEAGYGPKLGPLIITGTAWEVQGHPDRDSLDRLFQPLREPHLCGEISVVVDDSKAVFKPSSGLAGLHAVVSACMHWCKRPENSLLPALPWLAGMDLESIRSTPWLEMQDHDEPWVTASETKECLESWQSTGLRLVGVSSRVITAKAFNEFCAGGTNKADLLSQTTLNLVKTLLAEYQGSSDFVDVYCDRHGGRRYYAGVLQHVFAEHLAQVHSETAKESSYLLTGGGPDVSVRFTVKGDRFSPVALASMHAKYLRERCMQAFNHYFADRHVGQLKPTAGYPVDADRYLAAIVEVVAREKIKQEHLVRDR